MPITIRHYRTQPRFPRGFTLVELLVVVAIIGLLIAILLPALSKAQRTAKLTVELGNMRQVGLAVHMYGNDYENAALGTGGYEYDHAFPRFQLYSGDYLSSGENLRADSEPWNRTWWRSDVWGCPLAKDRNMSEAQSVRSWFWMVGAVGGTFTEDGKITTIFADAGSPATAGDPTDDTIRLDGTGLYLKRGGHFPNITLSDPYRGSVSSVVLICDASKMAEYWIVSGGSTAFVGHAHNPWPIYDTTIKPTETTSLMLDGHAAIRQPGEMRSASANGFQSWY